MEIKIIIFICEIKFSRIWLTSQLYKKIKVKKKIKNRLISVNARYRLL